MHRIQIGLLERGARESQLGTILLTTTELISRMNNHWEDAEDVAIEDSIQALRCCGLVRITAGIVEPTFAALRAHAILSV